jgi:hypothetical protein
MITFLMRVSSARQQPQNSLHASRGIPDRRECPAFPASKYYLLRSIAKTKLAADGNNIDLHGGVYGMTRGSLTISIPSNTIRDIAVPYRRLCRHLEAPRPQVRPIHWIGTLSRGIRCAVAHEMAEVDIGGYIHPSDRSRSTAADTKTWWRPA